ncbi:hypothetical protein [Embleya hyalina]|uniref:Uncharacterized protein n=1 Tax=Embleya hyalina TaxID=516124 RepID=A0A401YYV5_9ACTN|nr:hypothetical protein [Embleya hyalina]GCD99777.1 hypothetical protein EHYA_07499 [Embleya hyalina]
MPGTETIVPWLLVVRVPPRDAAVPLPRVSGAGVRIGVAHLRHPPPPEASRPVSGGADRGGRAGGIGS